MCSVTLFHSILMEWNCLLIVVSLFLETHFKREIFLELHPTQSVSTPEVSEGSQ